LSFFATWLTGATAVLVNSRGASDEIVHALHDTDCAILIADAKRAAATANGFRGKVLVADDAGNFCDGSGRAFDISAAPVRISHAAPDDPAVIMFTSGTTGRPKGAVLSHRSIYTCMFGMQHSGAAQLIQAAGKLGVDPQTLAGSFPQMASLAFMPFFHVSGAEFVVLSALTHGGKIVIMKRWDAATALQLIERERVSQFSGPPSIFWDILAHPDLGKFDLSSLLNIGVGGQATPPQLLEALLRAIPNAAPSGGWGMTETNGSVAMFSGKDFLTKPLASGRILPVAAVRILDDGGKELPTGGIGEIWVKSALVMTGYWNQPEANRSSATRSARSTELPSKRIAAREPAARPGPPSARLPNHPSNS
jgi:acyl-CoA synthetase (AMP-forming)/AMP-acid ligase II